MYAGKMRRRTTGMIEVSVVISALFLTLNIYLAIRASVAWFSSHIKLNFPPIRGQTSSVPTIVLVTDDVANRELSLKENIQAISGTATYLCSLKRKWLMSLDSSSIYPRD